MIRRDDLGAPVPLVGPPRRVVSLVPSLTETIASVAPGRLVGATDYCVHPEELAVRRIGGSKYPMVDEVLDLSPDLVVANGEESRPQDVERLREHGIPVWVTAAPATVPEALESLRRLLDEVFDTPPPAWWQHASTQWQDIPPIRARVVVPVWRKPWIVLGPDTFAGDVLRRMGLANACVDLVDEATSTDERRYPRPSLERLRGLFTDTAADLLVLPDEPYAFHAADGPEAFPDVAYALISGRHLTWHGPSLATARSVLAAPIDDALAAAGLTDPA
ncbi:helical backbone metal receptor [Actinoalloteichus hymeniacidonis]|uniref:ABC-type Fe3+-hydroxamate transport system, periplasmic component n=1 Tax=Actinoalloteichus hymeniacidonis TaxID=340345 RepID=A0AAC9HU55_9PSEU|nr:helical backbone metal receptor [Actinoalloteichus hymeniacidonis]AOS65186.1 hypothetical protein TL08_22010 [Actinoalloteichus hymeniacidonis]MBB5906734.1 ABC-type Fe3+-hydroxamate transport system substrate-binding protein [Actinoalloteichus hymeniacidonis]